MTKKINIFQTLEEKGKNLRWFKDQAFKRTNPTAYVENELKRIEKYSQAQISYAKVVEGYLADERDKIFPQIEQALTQNLKQNLHLKDLSRIVRSQFSQDPLNSIGSIKRPPGGRFNFGQTTRFHSDYFKALYIAEDYDTAFEENYHSTKESIGDFAHFKTEVFLEDYLDLREDKAVIDFFNVLNTIKMPPEFKKLAKQLKVDPVELCSSSELLKRYIFTPKFKAWDTWLDQYSHSQWFGFYCYRAKIPGIIYPSVRYAGKFNIAIFYENFENSTSFVKLQKPEDWPTVAEDRKIVNKDNFAKF